MLQAHGAGPAIAVDPGFIQQSQDGDAPAIMEADTPDHMSGTLKSERLHQSFDGGIEAEGSHRGCDGQGSV
jgi:hypothetical protein